MSAKGKYCDPAKSNYVRRRVKAFGPHYERWRELAARMFHVPPDEWAWTEVMAWNIMAVMAARKAGA